MIRSYQVSLVELPLPRPMATAIHRTQAVYCALLQVQTDDAEGQSFVFSLNRHRALALKPMIDSLAAIYVQADENAVESLWQQALADLNPVGTQGFAISALTAWDTAVWDAIGCARQMPLCQMFGQVRDQLSAYASSGLWLNQSIDELINEAADFVAQGFRQIKLRVDGDIQASADRAMALRQALGDSIGILADANQSLDVDTAIQLARALERADIVWLEEPVIHHDLAGQRQVKDSSPIPIASGETDYTARGLEPTLAAGATDVLMPDLQRMGGLSEMRVVSDLAARYHTPISTHIFTEYSLSIAGSAPNCISVEHVDWFAGLFTQPVVIDQGQAQIPNGPGTGFRFDLDRIRDGLIG